MRLDRFLIRRGNHSCREVAALLAEGRVRVDGAVGTDGRHAVSRFSWIELDGETLQRHDAVYLMLHKPAGHLSATTDPVHPTVIDLIDPSLRAELHLAGRLDRASTGLLLLSNDGRWTKQVTLPEIGIPKTYQVSTRDPIPPSVAELFARGLYFAYEDITTRPARLEITGEREALLTLVEGRYHQVKRMFHAVGNQVTALHRQSIGPLRLDASLPPGRCRPLTAGEVAWFRNPSEGG